MSFCWVVGWASGVWACVGFGGGRGRKCTWDIIGRPVVLFALFPPCLTRFRVQPHIDRLCGGRDTCPRRGRLISALTSCGVLSASCGTWQRRGSKTVAAMEQVSDGRRYLGKSCHWCMLLLHTPVDTQALYFQFPTPCSGAEARCERRNAGEGRGRSREHQSRGLGMQR